ncbi:MAG: 3-oxoacid CoA-transferase subunit B [Acholeplasmataceae bacterium]
MSRIKEAIAKRVALELKDGDLVNLGIGLPTLVANFVPSDIEVYFQSENGLIGLGPSPEEGKEDVNLTNAGGQYVTIKKHGAFFDSVTSFGIIRGHHVDITVLGALEVDEEGSLASWIIPNRMVPGMGGAMDLVVGAKRVIIATTHTNKKGEAKIKKRCTLPLTAYREVDMIVTELAVIAVRADGLHLIEKHPDVTLEEILAKTEAKLVIGDVRDMEVFK